MRSFFIVALLLVSSLKSACPSMDYDWFITSIERNQELQTILARERHINRIAAVIRHIESRNNYHKRGDLGEIGAYQFMPSTWNRLCKKYYGGYLKPTKENQDSIARRYVKNLVNSGYTVSQIGSIWNSGYPNCTKIGVVIRANGDTARTAQGKPITFNVPKYRKMFVSHYKFMKNA